MSSFTRRAPREFVNTCTRTHAYPIPPHGRTYTGKRCASMCMCEWLRKMAMDRTMYGKVEPSDIYQPYRITMKKGSPPGCKSDIFFDSQVL